MKQLSLLACISGVILVSACSSMSHNEFKGKTYEYMAWFDGDASAEFDPYRKILSEKLDEVEGGAEETPNTEKYLEYLALMDASGKKSDVESRIKAFVSKNPEEKRGLFLLGVHYMRNKKKELANHFFTLLEKDPNFTWKSLLYNNLGMLSLQEKESR